MTMPMLERYLNAIAFWLPEGQRQDIIAEIAEDLNAQIEDQQASLGRNLNESEVAALLQRRGRPVLVANRYLPQQTLIGPIWFPAYLFVLKMVGLCYVLPWLVVFLVVNRVQHPDLVWSATLLTAWATVWTVVFVAAGMVTLIFAILELAAKKTKFLEKWNPRQLPAVRDPHKIPAASSITELVANVVFLLWWLGYASSPLLFNGLAFQLKLGPEWTVYFWGYAIIAVLNIWLAAMNFKSRSWTGLRATARLVLDVSGGTLFCWLMRTHLGAQLYIANLSPAQMSVLKSAIHPWKERCFPFAVIVVVILAVTDLIRISRVSRTKRVVLAPGIPA
jgi:hypothetical protein